MLVKSKPDTVWWHKKTAVFRNYNFSCTKCY